MGHDRKKITKKNNTPLTIEVNGRPSGRPILEIVEPPRIDKRKPWLYEDGTKITDEKLKEVSQSWDANTWEKYLRETVDRRKLEEDLFSKRPGAIEYVFTQGDHNQFIKEYFSRDKYENLSRLLRFQIEAKLSKNQMKIIKLHFWQGLSHREIAKKLGIHRGTVRSSIERSLAKLKEILSKKVSS